MQDTSSANSGGTYDDLLTIVKGAKEISYDEFDKLVLTHLNLFDVPDDDYLFIVEDTLDKIIQALPAFKRIFAKPIIRLTDARQIVPIEAVKLIDNYSLTHISSRSELWDDITSSGIKPRKLMTTEHVETYSIYENIAFVYAVDTILAFIKQTVMLFKDILYGCRDLHFNMLDRTHHSLYFLAIGKLHLEYARARASQSGWSRCIEKLMFIDKTLRSKLHSPVYTKCKKLKSPITLKKTNIFRSHKDYSKVYNLLKWLECDMKNATARSAQISPSSEEYKAFCSCLSVFSAGHFNFSFSKHTRFELSCLDTTCTFRDWTLKLKMVKTELADGLLFTFNKDKEYKSCIIFCDKSALTTAQLEKITSSIVADEYFFASANNYGEKGILYLSIFDVDSFRRIQQIFLRGMIYSDNKKTVCPFCGHDLVISDEIHECHICRAQIIEKICPETKKVYYLSEIKKLRSRSQPQKEASDKQRFLHDRLDEAQFHFRNITPILSSGTPVCPHCGKYHLPLSDD